MFNNKLENGLEVLERDSELIDEILSLYKNWPEYVTEISPESILFLHENNLLKIKRNESEKIVATLYKKPLRKDIGIFDREQIFRIGGLATDGSNESKKFVVELMNDLLEETLIKNQKLIAKTDNLVVARFLKKLGMEELPFEDAKNKYPKAVKLYLEAGDKSESEYLGTNFYFYNIKE